MPKKLRSASIRASSQGQRTHYAQTKNYDPTEIEDLVKFFLRSLTERAKPKVSHQSRLYCTAPAPCGDSSGRDG